MYRSVERGAYSRLMLSRVAICSSDPALILFAIIILSNVINVNRNQGFLSVFTLKTDFLCLYLLFLIGDFYLNSQNHRYPLQKISNWIFLWANRTIVRFMELYKVILFFASIIGTKMSLGFVPFFLCCSSSRFSRPFCPLLGVFLSWRFEFPISDGVSKSLVI